MWPQVKYKQKWCETTSSEPIDACQDLLWSLITWIFTVSGRNTSSSETVKPSLVTIVQECGPSWICQNTSMGIMYGNNIVLYSYIVMLWGKKKKPFLPFIATCEHRGWWHCTYSAQALQRPIRVVILWEAVRRDPVLRAGLMGHLYWSHGRSKHIDPFNRKFPCFHVLSSLQR